MSSMVQTYKVHMYLASSVTNLIFAETTQIYVVYCVYEFKKSGQICRFLWTSML